MHPCVASKGIGEPIAAQKFLDKSTKSLQIILNLMPSFSKMPPKT